MRASELWDTTTRFIEIGARQYALGDWLGRAGYHRYLHVTAHRPDFERLTAKRPEAAVHTCVATGRNVVRNNNADVLVLGPGAARGTFRFRNLRHARHIALPRGSGLGMFLMLCACWWHVLWGRLEPPVRIALGGEGGEQLLVFAIRKRRVPGGARHYIPHALSTAGFLKRLNSDRVRYAALRWFDALPELPPGEDLDLLVDDEHLERVLDILGEGPGIQPCDVYSETGLPRSDFRRMPYFPPRLAKELLDEAVTHNVHYRVPSPRHHLLSLAYHAWYHKGPKSGIPEHTPQPGARGSADHDYATVLADLAKREGIELDVTKGGVDALLAEQDWRPPRDMLLRLGKRNRWVRQSLHVEPERPEDRGLATFVLRREALHRGGLAKLRALLEQAGFSILTTKLLGDNEVRHVAANIRGGNWGRGPWPTSGGPPAAIVIAYDPQPQALTRRQRKKFPLATNARLLEKGRIRDAFNEGLPAEQHCNTVHSSDNSGEAWEYIQLAMPEAGNDIRRELASRHVAHLDPAPSRDLTRFGRRARLELIEVQGRRLVRKTFKPGCEDYCRREAHAMRELAQRVTQIPELVDAGERTVTYPYYDDVLGYERSSGWLMPIDVATEAVLALRRVYEAGYALIDASIDNVLIDRREGLKLIDFEFLYRYETQPESFAKSYDIAGTPVDFDGPVPTGGAKNYRRNWMPYTGLTLDSLLHDPRWLQHVKRAVYVALRPHRYLPRRVRYFYRRARGETGTRHPAATPSAPTQVRHAA